MKLTQLALSVVICAYSATGFAKLNVLSDQDLAQVQGQALLSLTQTNGTSPVDSSAIGFYKLGAEALIEINANIKRLQLGCGGVNGAGGCDIDIENLSISGLNDGTDASGSPTYSNGRASTSAKITNPFIEFAIKNPTNLSNREVVGFRLGAQEILGMLSLGTENTTNPTDGLRSLSGYLQIAQTTGSVMTAPTKFADVENEKLKPPASLTALGTTTTFTSVPTNANNTGITVPSSPATFVLPQTTVKGARMSSIVINNIPALAAKIPLAAGSGVAGVNDAIFANDQLYVNLTDCILGLVCNAEFKMDTGSELTNLNINVTSFTQALNAIHNIPLTGSGGYLSLQKEAVKWNGSNSDDTAQRGWWLSLKDPVQLGVLNVTNQVDISSVLPQVANLVSNYLGDNPVDPGGTSINAAFGVPTRAVLKIDLGTATQNTPATIALTSQIFNSQKPASNCYGNLKFC